MIDPGSGHDPDVEPCYPCPSCGVCMGATAEHTAAHTAWEAEQAAAAEAAAARHARVDALLALNADAIDSHLAGQP